MPSYNGILTTSCIRTLTQIALKLSGFICLVSVLSILAVYYPVKLLLHFTCFYSLQDHVIELVIPFRDFNCMWEVRVEASRALLDLEFHRKGIDATLLLFIKYTEEEPSLRGFVHCCFLLGTSLFQTSFC